MTISSGFVPTAGAQRLAEFAASLAFEDIPEDVIEAVKLHLLDTLGCGIAAHALGSGTHSSQAVLDGEATGPASVIGAQRGLPAADAALANGTLCHALDFDDTHAESICHVSVVVCPAALAAAEAARVDGRTLLVAITAGNEVVTRVGGLAAPAYMERGFHPTSVCGVFGAVAAAGCAARLEAPPLTAALGIAGSMASGIFEYLADGSNTKPIHAGWAAHAGIVATRLAAYGARGPASVLEGRFGLYAAYFGIDHAAVEERFADLGARWETPRIAFKPYPACHFVHSCVDAAAAAVAEARPRPEEIDEIVVEVPEPAVSLVLEPREAKVAPRSDYDAKFSLQYSVAAMLVHGEVGVGTYTDDAIRDPRVLALAKRVRHEVRDFPTYPAALPGRTRIRLLDGRELSAELTHQRGGPDNPLSADAVVQKFRDNARHGLDAAATDALETAVLSLDRHDDVGAALAPLRMAGATAVVA